MGMDKPLFLVERLEEMDRDVPIFDATIPLGRGETVIGIMSPYCQKIFSLGAYYVREYKRLYADLDFVSDPIEKSKIERELYILNSKAEWYTKTLWKCTRMEFSVYGNDCIGLRRGFQVVTYSPSNKISIGDLLFKLGIPGIEPGGDQ